MMKSLFIKADSPSAIAAIEDDTKLSYNELFEFADSIAQGVDARSLVLFVADNSLSSLAAYVGFLRKRIVPIMVRQDIGETLLQSLIEVYRPSHIWQQDSGNDLGDLVWSNHSHSLVATRIGPPELYRDLALLLTTSGSTGSQKYVRLSYENIESNAISIVQYLRITSRDVAITTLPLSYTFGLSIIHSHLLAGASVVMTRYSLFDREFWSSFRDNNVTSLSGVPYTYTMLKRLHFERMELPSLRYLTQAGGHLDNALQEDFGLLCQKRGLEFFIMYGQTEGTARLSYLPPELVLKKVGSIGKAIPGGRLVLVDENNQEIHAPDVVGELVYYGPNVSLGYASGYKDLSLDDEWKGRLETGDLAKTDEDGFFTIIGRKKRFLKMFGNRVNLDELEAFLDSRGFVTACSGKDDSMKVYIEQGDTREIQDAVSELTGLYAHAIEYIGIDKLPRSESGKILYSSLET